MVSRRAPFAERMMTFAIVPSGSTLCASTHK
jgi:hypothetical protein